MRFIRNHFANRAFFYLIAFSFMISCAKTGVKTTQHERSNLVQSAYIWLLSLGGLSVVSCGKVSSTAAGLTISGVAQLGRIENATVTLTGAVSGTIYGTGTTDADGAYSVKPNSIPTEPVSVEITGNAAGTSCYTDEATSTKVCLATTDKITALVPDASTSQTTVAVTAFSHEAAQLAMTQMKDNLATMNPTDMKAA